MSSAEDIKDVLAAEASLNLVFASNLFVSRQPTTPDNCVTVYDTGGMDSHWGNEKFDYERPSIQIQVRNHSYSRGYDLAYKIFNLLQGSSFIQGGYRYIGIWALQHVNHIGYDSNNLALFSLNFRIHRTPTT